MTLKRTLIGITIGAMTLASCATTDIDGETGGVSNRDLLGGALGAAGGYLACRAMDGNTTTCALLVVGGAAAGVIIAREMKPEDKATRAVALAEVLEGQAAFKSYSVAQTGNSGTIKLISSSTASDGRECRTIEETYTIRGEDPITEEFKLCKAANGEWENELLG